jgi:hypothetical protein
MLGVDGMTVTRSVHDRFEQDDRAAEGYGNEG